MRTFGSRRRSNPSRREESRRSAPSFRRRGRRGRVCDRATLSRHNKSDRPSASRKEALAHEDRRRNLLSPPATRIRLRHRPLPLFLWRVKNVSVFLKVEERNNWLRVIRFTYPKNEYFFGRQFLPFSFESPTTDCTLPTKRDPFISKITGYTAQVGTKKI